MSSSTAAASSLPVSPAPYAAAPRIAAGSAEFKRSNRAMFFGGFSCFALPAAMRGAGAYGAGDTGREDAEAVLEDMFVFRCKTR